MTSRKVILSFEQREENYLFEEKIILQIFSFMKIGPFRL